MSYKQLSAYSAKASSRIHLEKAHGPEYYTYISLGLKELIYPHRESLQDSIFTCVSLQNKVNPLLYINCKFTPLCPNKFPAADTADKLRMTAIWKMQVKTSNLLKNNYVKQSQGQAGLNQSGYSANPGSISRKNDSYNGSYMGE